MEVSDAKKGPFRVRRSIDPLGHRLLFPGVGPVRSFSRKLCQSVACRSFVRLSRPLGKAHSFCPANGKCTLTLLVRRSGRSLLARYPCSGSNTDIKAAATSTPTARAYASISSRAESPERCPSPEAGDPIAQFLPIEFMPVSVTCFTPHQALRR